jgi:hypothetical protein
MGYFVAFALEDSDDIIDADEVASNAGWAAFADWAAALPEDYPELGYLGEYGECHPGEALARLEADLGRALREKPGSPSWDVLEVGRRLLAVVRDRPAGAAGLVVTDGTEGEDGGAEGD